MNLHQTPKKDPRLAHRAEHSVLTPANPKAPKMLTVITLRPLGAKTEGERRQAEGMQLMSDIAAVNGWAFRHETVFNSAKAGGDRWCKKRENRRQVRRFQDNLWHRLSYHEPDVVLVSGLQTARQFCAALRDHVARESTIKDLYQLDYRHTESRYAVLVGGHRIRVRLCPDLAWYGCEVASRSKLPEGTWGRLLHDVRCYLSGDAQHWEARIEKTKLRRSLEGEMFAAGLTNQLIGGRPVVRLREDLQEDLSYE